MDIMTVLAAIPALAPAIPYLTAGIAVCAAVAAVLPHPAGATGVYARVYAAVNYVGFNFGKARNVTAPAVTAPSGTAPSGTAP